MKIFRDCIWLWVLGVSAHIILLDTPDTICEGMYDKRDWGGLISPHIEVSLKGDMENISVVIFEYKDTHLLGAPLTSDGDKGNKKYICDSKAVRNELCSQQHLGSYIVSPLSTNTSFAKIKTKFLSKLIHDQNQEDEHTKPTLKYHILKTGYYCVSTYSMSGTIKSQNSAIIMNFQNAFGNLPASVVPNLSLFGGLAVAYLVIFALWMFTYVQFKNTVSDIQVYFTKTAGFLVFEMILIWGYYDMINIKGVGWYSGVYLLVLSFINAFRNTFCFYLLLTVAYGFGTTYDSLSLPVLKKCRTMGIIQVVAAIIYSMVSYISSAGNTFAGGWFLVAVTPIAISTTYFYILILTTINKTIKILKSQRHLQLDDGIKLKLQFYRGLNYLLTFTLIVIFLFYLSGLILILKMKTEEYITNTWQWRWFVINGWSNLVFTIVFAIIAVLGRPTKENLIFKPINFGGNDEETMYARAGLDEIELQDVGNENYTDSSDRIDRVFSSDEEEYLENENTDINETVDDGESQDQALLGKKRN